MCQTKESNKRAPGRVVSVHLVLTYTLTFSNVLLVLALNLVVHKSSYCKCSLAWCQARTFLLLTIWTHPLQMREYPLQYASTDKNKKSHYNNFTLNFVWTIRVIVILQIYQNLISWTHVFLFRNNFWKISPCWAIQIQEKDTNKFTQYWTQWDSTCRTRGKI